MILRNGILSILRERGRTARFALLIVLLTVAVISSLSVLLYCRAMMDACDGAYRSIALLEYMGAEYPNEDEPDAAARQAAEALKDADVLAVPGVTAWTRGNTASGYVEGYDRRTANTPYGGKGVIVVSNVSDLICQGAEQDENGEPVITEDSSLYYTAFLKDALYLQQDRAGTYVDLLAGDSEFVPEAEKSYVLNGSFLDVSRMDRQSGAYPMNGLQIFRVESFRETDALPYAEVTEEQDIPAVFTRAAEQYRIMNNYIRVVPCRDVENVYVFQQIELLLAQGAMPDPGCVNACVVSADLAERLGLKPGDSFELRRLRGEAEDRYYLRLTGETETLTVSGVANQSLDNYGTVWVIREDADDPLFGYLLGTAFLENDEAEEAVEALRALVPDQVRVTLLDQGYNAAVQPFRDVKKTSADVLIVSAAGVAAVLLLFAFLFIGRQNDTVKIMVSLGTPRRKIALWFLSGALLICGICAGIGTALGTYLRPYVIRLVSWIASSVRGQEGFLWYSETSIGLVKEMAFDLELPLWPNLAAMLGIVALALVFCLLFLRLARRGGTRRRGRSRVRVPHGKTSVLGRGGLRFALLSIRRGGLRTLLVPLISLVLTVTVIALGGIYQNWQKELDDVLDNAELDGMVVSMDGRYYSDLAMTLPALQTLQSVEGVEDVSVSYDFRYWLPEEMPVFSNGESGRQRRESWIAAQPELIALNALDAAKDFYYSDPNVTWLEGWDETMLSETNLKPLHLRTGGADMEAVVPAVCSTRFLEAHRMALGDTVACMVQFNLMEIPVVIQAVGSYVQREGKANIYAPLSCYIPPALLTGGEIPDGILPPETTKEELAKAFSRFTFRTCRFRPSSARELEAVRERLREQGFSAVGHTSLIRTTVLFRDASFLKLTENMRRNIVMGKVMSAVISLLTVLMGFIISWLMTFSRRREFALMRGFGAKKRRVFASFFLEQAILSLLGCLAGCLALKKLYAGGLTQPVAAAACLICYLLGTAKSIRMIGQTDLMELLTVRE
ncbi:MAG: FtsX-like permease family protein [Oscillospiraceae bacterium]|nr:FtsX-like permease family protein [Oscillospiraceae bacterium]